MNHGVKPVRPDSRDLSHTRTFGAITPHTFPDEFNIDAGLTNPDQNADGYPNGCTGYTQSELCTDEDKIVYKPSYTYDKTRFMEGVQGKDVGCDIRDSLKSTLVYGVQGLDELTDGQAFQHRRGSYYAVEQAPDWFDGIRSALTKGHSVSMATPWFPEFSSPINGIVPFPSDFNTRRGSWHNWKVCGWKTIAGIPYLKAKPWIGPNYGDNGFCYFSQPIINKLLDLYYTGAFVVDRYTEDAKPVVLTSLYEVVLSYLYRMLALLQKVGAIITG